MNHERRPHPSRRSSMPRLLLFIVPLLLAPLAARAQSTGIVTGTASDSDTHAPVKAAVTVLRDRTDTTLKALSTMTDDHGAFEFRNAIPGHVYTLVIRAGGYDAFTQEKITPTAAQPRVDVGAIALRQRVVETPGVEVTATRAEVRVLADKTVYGVENNPTYSATTVSELLAQIPSVSVDQDGKVSLRGNENVTIMMNDRPLTMPREQRDKFLQSLPANVVKDIEVRNNPGAEFEAKNQGGIINIVTRRTMSDVLGGNVNGGIDNRVGGSGGAGLYFNGQGLNASLTGGGSIGPGSGSSSSLRLNFLDTNERRNVGEGISTSTSKSWYIYGQADYNFTDDDLASVSYSNNHWYSNYTGYGTHTFYNTHDVVVGRFLDTSTRTPGAPNGGGYDEMSLLLKHSFTKEHTLGLDVSYSGYSYASGSDYSTTYFSQSGEFDSLRSTKRQTLNDESNHTLIMRLDYANPIEDKLKLTFGARNEINFLDDETTIRTWDRTSAAFVLDTLQSSHYKPKNTIYALYGEAAWIPVEGVNLQFGLRVERANVAAKYASGVEIVSRDYTNLFPSGSIGYTLAEAHTVTLSYRRSIALPDVDALNPTVVKWNDLFLTSGNPDLEPEFTHSLQLAYSTFWGMGNMLSFSPYYNTTIGNIERSQQLVGGATFSRSENYNGTYSTGAELSFSMRPTDWFNFRLGGEVYQQVNRGSAIPGDIHSSATGYSGNGSVSLDIMKGLTFSFNTFFRQPATVGADHRSGYTFITMSLRQKLLDDKLSITLRANDPFDMQQWNNTFSDANFYTESTSHWTSQYFGLNLSYNFGTIPRMERHQQEKTETKGGGGTGGGGGGGGGQ